MVIIRKAVPQLGRIAFGMLLVVVGLAIFLVGLEKCIFPLGKSMANQLADPVFLANGNPELLQALLAHKASMNVSNCSVWKSVSNIGRLLQSMCPVRRPFTGTARQEVHSRRGENRSTITPILNNAIE
jgi:hypothetical protein